MTFQSGQSGNPNGRPKGIVDKRVKLRQLLEPHAERLIEKVVELALAGDISALKICIDRLIPRLKDDGEPDPQHSMQDTMRRIRDAADKYEY